MAPTLDKRAAPDALLAEAEQAGRGRLMIYLGMAPGVGKTYAMLEGARRLQAQGVEVVAGIIETHGRAATIALAQGLETLPRRKIAYRGQTLEEFDIDAALARRPALLLVDELAHTNAPDCRHPKRWQDVEELIRAGIDVHTTVNVQHLESLSDVVARITGVRVAETLPDGVLDRADDIELVDLTPQELIARLTEGKIYAPRLAGQARESFFKLGNLTALRELALRRAAERVDSQLVGYMQAHAIEGPWAAGERIMALVGPDGLGSAVVRAADRIADQLKAPFTAVTVESQGRLLSSSAVSSIGEALTLAERLGGGIERLTSSDLAGDILAYARKNNITQIFVGRSRSPWWRDVLRRSLVGALIRRASGVAVHVISELPEKPARPLPVSRPLIQQAWAYGSGLLSVGAVVALAAVVRDLATGANVAMLFLAAVLFSAVSFGLGPAIATALGAFLAYNFFFTEPYYALLVEHWHDLITLGVFLVVAITTGALAGRSRNQALAERARMKALETLYDFSRRLGAKSTVDDLLHALVLQVQRLTGEPVIFLRPDGDDVVIRYAWPPEDQLPERDMAAARWTQKHGEAAGAGTGTLPSAAWHFRPMRSTAAVQGVLGLRCDRAPPRDLLQTIDAVLDQGAVAFDRIAYAVDAAAVQAMTETERLRGALLSSISHDLRTPLTSVVGAASALRQDADRLAATERDALLATIEDEARRLDRYVNNLLDMTRLEAGALAPKREWVDVHDAVDGALRRLRREAAGHAIVRALPLDLPPVAADPVLIETVLVNLLDNAIKYGGGALEIAAREMDETVAIAIGDDGPGIPPDALPHVFDKFYRPARSAATGAGLGLSICHGFVAAMGGSIRAESPFAPGRGTRITVTLPSGRRPASDAGAPR